MTLSVAARRCLALGALYGFLCVVLGAFGAHALREHLTVDRLVIWHTGVEYQFYHALALLLCGLWLQWQPRRALHVAAICLGIGVPLFSGSLYALVLTDTDMLGAITPFGGVLFLVAWAALLWAAVKPLPPG
ncbi:DUF423 domain-containing protein [Solimonas marina]|uniref:DUF423 domain-containing protein n=1 Tax=Solimonas marina TaxID=2714601 RepID=A0A969WC89_9GAMM|nr:DUF423 domain-containing protein [Solimonas marina]NKF22771.1 DUF423 domain-containing protein [Solimonas marina]